MNARNRDSCRWLFRNLNILPFKSQHVFSLPLFVAKHRYLYESDSVIHNINTRSSFDYSNSKLAKKDPFILELKSLISFPLA
jgi:hypothetical protein